MSIHKSTAFTLLACLAAVGLGFLTTAVLFGAENPFKPPKGAVKGDADHKVSDTWEEFEGDADAQAVLTVTTNDDPGVYNDLHYEIEYHGQGIDEEPPPPREFNVIVQSKWDIKCPAGKFLNSPIKLKIPPPADITTVLQAFYLVVWTIDGESKLYRIGEVD